MTHSIKQFGIDVNTSASIDIAALQNNVMKLPVETITSKGSKGDGILHIAFRTGNKDVINVVLNRVKALHNCGDVLKKLLAVDNNAGVTPLEILASKNDDLIKDIMKDILSNSKEFVQIILSDASSSFGNNLEHLLAVKGKDESLMEVVNYKITNGIEFNTNEPGNYFYFESCLVQKYGAVSKFLDKISSNTSAKATALSKADVAGETLLYKAIAAYARDKVEAISFLTKILAIVDSVDELKSLFSEKVLIEFVMKLDLLPMLKNAKAFQADADKSEFVQFLTNTKLVDQLVATLNQDQDNTATLNALQTFIGTDLIEQNYKALFYQHQNAKKYSALTKLLQVSSDHTFLTDIVCPKIALAIAADKKIVLDSSALATVANLEELKAIATSVIEELPATFGACSPILSNFVKDIEFQQTARALEGEAQKSQDFGVVLKACIMQNSLINKVLSDSETLATYFASLPEESKDQKYMISYVQEVRICVFETSKYKILEEVASTTTIVDKKSDYCNRLALAKETAQDSKSASICTLDIEADLGIGVPEFQHFLNTRVSVYAEVSRENIQNLENSLKTLNPSVNCTGKDFPQCSNIAVEEGNKHRSTFCSNVHDVDKTAGFKFGNVTLTQNSTNCAGDGTVHKYFTDDFTE
jgi:hypothetical protein